MASKSMLVDLVSKDINYLAKDDIKSVVDLILQNITEELASGNRIEVRGFGSFSIRSRKIPGTDKTRRVVYYKMAKGCFEDINSCGLE